jgi:GAF domain-containing protein
MSWAIKPPSLAEHATIELRRISDVLQIDHASLFLRDSEHRHGAVLIAETGRPLAAALAEHATIVARVLSTGRVQEVEPGARADGPVGAALATPLEHEGEAVGALLVVTLRPNRRLGAADAQVIGRATENLMERILPVAPQRPHAVSSDRFSRANPARPARARR